MAAPCFFLGGGAAWRAAGGGGTGRAGAPGGRPRRQARDQLQVGQSVRFVRRVPIDQVQRLPGGDLAELARILPHGRQSVLLGVRRVVEPGQRYPLRDGDAVAGQREGERQSAHIGVAAQCRGHVRPEGDQLAGHPLHRVIGPLVEEQLASPDRRAGAVAGVVEPQCPGLGAVRELGGDDRADVGDVGVAQRQQVFGHLAHARAVVDADRGVAGFRGGRVDADDRHMDAAQALRFVRFDGERRDDHRVGVAPHGQRGEKASALLRGLDLVDDDVVSGGAERGVQPGEQVGIEPRRDVLADQQGDAERSAGLHRGGRSRNRIVERLRGGVHALAGLLGDQIRLGECARHGGDGDAGLDGDLRDSRFHGVLLMLAWRLRPFRPQVIPACLGSFYLVSCAKI